MAKDELVEGQASRALQQGQRVLDPAIATRCSRWYGDLVWEIGASVSQGSSNVTCVLPLCILVLICLVCPYRMDCILRLKPVMQTAAAPLPYHSSCATDAYPSM